VRTECDKHLVPREVAELAMAEEAAERASRWAQEALQAVEAIAAASARAEADRSARSRAPTPRCVAGGRAGVFGAGRESSRPHRPVEFDMLGRDGRRPLPARTRFYHAKGRAYRLTSLSRECRNQADGVGSLLGRPGVTGRNGTGKGFQPAMVRAHARACSGSVTAGNSRRSSTAADNSPLCA
jgi:hypothetical protein